MRSGDSWANRDRIAFWLIDEWAISLALRGASAGRGGIAAVSRITGIARSTIGVNELRAGEPCDASRVRRPGGGRKPLSETDPTLRDDLRSLVEPDTRGDPQSPLLWTCKRLRKLSEACRAIGLALPVRAARMFRIAPGKIGQSLET